MNELPCKTCLKFPICVSKNILKCVDLVDWLTKYRTYENRHAERIMNFEKWWDRDVCLIIQDVPMISFKKEKDNYQCLIV